MAVEVCGQVYHFEPGREPPPNIVRLLCRRFPLLDGDDEPSDEGDVILTAPKYSGTLTSFYFNPLHDLESLWWISAYFLLSRTLTLPGDNAERTDAEDPRLARQRTAAQKLFVIGDERQWAVCGESEFYREFKTLRPLTRKLGRALDIARDTLVRAYHYVEQDLDNRAFEVRSEVYEEMCEIYTKIAKRLEGEDVMTGHLMMW